LAFIEWVITIFVLEKQLMQVMILMGFFNTKNHY